jgi:protein involved in polysaccharide export with SLBB domain
MRVRVGARAALGLAVGLGVAVAGAGGAGAQAPEDELRGAMLEAQTRGLADTLAAQRAVIARPVLSGPVEAEHYRLGPGDVLSLEYGGKASGSRSFAVDGEGRVRVPELGVLAAGGRTLAEFRADVLRRLKAYLPGAAMDLRLVQPRTFKLYVLGEVKSPGVVEVVGSARVLEAIEAAGGTTERASTRNVRVVGRGGETGLADLRSFQRTGAWEANPYLQDGDRVVVPLAVERLGVYGAVAAADVYEFRAGDRLSTAIDVAGGLRPEARLDSVQIVRFRSAATLDTLYADLAAVRDGRAEDIPLLADDRVFVRPKADWHRAQGVTIDGEVRFPGGYAIEEGKHRLSEVIGWAGGFNPEAARANVRVERRLDATTRDTEFERLSRMTRAEMTNSEYQTFRGKLALRQASYLVDFSSGVPQPPQSDVLLKDGDRIEVGRLELAVRVDGMVKRPGLIAYQEGLGVRDYVRLAGGPTARAAGGDMRLTRAGSSATQFARDVKKVEPGDFIWVPEKKDVNFWTVFRDVIIVAGQMATIVLVIDQLSQP